VQKKREDTKKNMEQKTKAQKPTLTLPIATTSTPATLPRETTDAIFQRHSKSVNRAVTHVNASGDVRRADEPVLFLIEPHSIGEFVKNVVHGWEATEDPWYKLRRCVYQWIYEEEMRFFFYVDSQHPETFLTVLVHGYEQVISAACSNLPGCQTIAIWTPRIAFFAGGTPGGSIINMCCVCGQKGTKADILVCGQCKSVHYCSKEHQRMDWPEHKKACAGLIGRRSKGALGKLYPKQTSRPAILGTRTPRMVKALADLFSSGSSPFFSSGPSRSKKERSKKTGLLFF